MEQSGRLGRSVSQKRSSLYVWFSKTFWTGSVHQEIHEGKGQEPSQKNTLDSRASSQNQVKKKRDQHVT